MTRGLRVFDIGKFRLNVDGVPGECSFSGADRVLTCTPSFCFTDLRRPRAIDPCEWGPDCCDGPPDWRVVAVRAAALTPCTVVGVGCGLLTGGWLGVLPWTGRCVP